MGFLKLKLGMKLVQVLTPFSPSFTTVEEFGEVSQTLFLTSLRDSE